MCAWCTCVSYLALTCYVFNMLHSVTVSQPSPDAQVESKASAVHLSALRRQHRPADHDPDVTQLSGGLHQQFPLQFGRQQLLWAPVCRRHQVQTGFKQFETIVPFAHTAHAHLFLLCSSPSFPFPHSINPVAYQQLLSQQRGLSAFGHTPPLIQPSPTFSSRHPLSLSALPTPTASDMDAKVTRD